MNGVLCQTSTRTIGDDRDEGAREPVEVHVEQAELTAEVVDGAVLDAEHHAPRHGRHDRRHHGRDGQERGDDRAPAADAREEQGEAEADEQLEHQRGPDDDRRVPDRVDEAARRGTAPRRSSAPPTNSQSGPTDRSKFAEREPERIAERKDDDERDQDQRGRGEREGFPALALERNRTDLHRASSAEHVTGGPRSAECRDSAPGARGLSRPMRRPHLRRAVSPCCPRSRTAGSASPPAGGATRRPVDRPRSSEGAVEAPSEATSLRRRSAPRRSSRGRRRRG